MTQHSLETTGAPPEAPEAAARFDTLDGAIEKAVARYFQSLFRATNGNVAKAARIAGRNRTELYRFLKKHGIDPRSPENQLQEAPEAPVKFDTLDGAIKKATVRYLRNVFRETNGDVAKAARIAARSRTGMYPLSWCHGVDPGFPFPVQASWPQAQ